MKPESEKKSSSPFWAGVGEQGWRGLFDFDFFSPKTTWCIRTITKCPSRPSPMGPEWSECRRAAPGRVSGSWISCGSADTLWGQVIYFGRLPCLRKACLCECVSGGQKELGRRVWAVDLLTEQRSHLSTPTHTAYDMLDMLDTWWSCGRKELNATFTL